DRRLHPAQIYHAQPPARGRGGEVGRPQQRLALVVQLIALLPAEAVVPGGDHIHPAVEQVLRRGGGDAVAVGGICPVGDDQVDGFQPFEGGQAAAEELAADAAHHVADTQDVQVGRSFLPWASICRRSSPSQLGERGRAARSRWVSVINWGTAV